MSLKHANNVMWEKQAAKQISNSDPPPLERGDTPPPQHTQTQKNDKSVINITSDDAGSCTDTANTSSSSTFSGNTFSDNVPRNMIITSSPQIVVYHQPTNINNNHYSTQQYVLSSPQSPLFIHTSDCIQLPLLNTRKTTHNLPLTMTNKAASTSNKKRRINTSNKSNKRRKLNNCKAQTQAQHDDETIYCICRKKDDGTKMVGCDLCSEWFHIRCVNVSKAQFKKIKKGASFSCPLCHKKHNNDKKQKKHKKHTETDESCDNAPNKKNKKTEERAVIMDSMLGLTSDEEDEDKRTKQKKKEIDLRIYRMNIDPILITSTSNDDNDNEMVVSDGGLRYNVWA